MATLCFLPKCHGLAGSQMISEVSLDKLRTVGCPESSPFFGPMSIREFYRPVLQRALAVTA